MLSYAEALAAAQVQLPGASADEINRRCSDLLIRQTRSRMRQRTVSTQTADVATLATAVAGGGASADTVARINTDLLIRGGRARWTMEPTPTASAAHGVTAVLRARTVAAHGVTASLVATP